MRASGRRAGRLVRLPARGAALVTAHVTMVVFFCPGAPSGVLVS